MPTSPNFNNLSQVERELLFDGAQKALQGESDGITPSQGNAATVFHTANYMPASGSTGTDTTPAVTESYIAEVRISVNTTITGIAPNFGSLATGAVSVGLADSNGRIVASAASVVQTGVNAYQQIPFTTPYTAIGPNKYYVVLQMNNTNARFRSLVVGNCGAGKITGETFGSFATLYKPTTFTTNLGPIADTY